MKKLLVFALLSILAIAPSLSTVRAETLPPYELPPPQELARIQSGIISTSRGDIYVELYPSDAPWSVANFKYLADKGYYRGSNFHYVKERYVIIGGGRSGDGSGGPGYSIRPEFNTRHHEPGTLGMVRNLDSVNPERVSHGSQFQIFVSPAPHLDGSYTIFGKVIRGMDIVEQIRQGDRITDVKVFVKP